MGVPVTQQQLADQAGLTRSSIANVEAGRQRVPLHVLAAIALALKVEPQDLLPGGLESTASVLTLPEPDSESSRRFVETTVAKVGLSVRWTGGEA
jgi:transcriptional regulator with XRE-family HTH domain